VFLTKCFFLQFNSKEKTFFEQEKKMGKGIKRYYSIIIAAVVSLISFTLTTCNPTEPICPEPKPPGYQEDIPWPSLADSPWPMYQHDPQNTGRSKYKGPQFGVTKWDYDSVYIESSVVIGLNGSIIFQTSRPGFDRGGVFDIGSSGNLNWYYKVNEVAARTTPLVMNDGKIIISTYIGGKIVALDPNGNEIWNYDTGGYINNVNLTVGLDGAIYFIDSTRTLYSLNSNGVLLWTMKIENAFSGNVVNPRLAFSPDGKRLYITGANHALYAVDIQTQSILWAYGNNFNVSPPVIDNAGNIYLSGKPKSDQRTSLTKLNPNGDEMWVNYWGNDTEPYFYTPTLDWNGNIYFGYDSLYSLTYDGVLRWKKDLFASVNGNILSSLSCDINGIIYVPIEVELRLCKIVAVRNDGIILWQSEVLVGAVGDSPALSDGIMFLPTYRSQKLYAIN
jgi:hypothetical protein